MELFVLPFLIGNAPLAIESQLKHKGDVPLYINDSGIKPDTMASMATSVDYFTARVRFSHSSSQKRRYIETSNGKGRVQIIEGDAKTINVLMDKRYREIHLFGSLLISFSVGISRRSNFFDYVPNYIISISDVFTGFEYFVADFDGNDFSGRLLTPKQFKLHGNQRELFNALENAFDCNVSFNPALPPY